ncbi:hypothetical protein KGF56_002608 [Candida oxycetoniae]|uniref:Genetic interactor of prohibitin 7, mitochondrial n=1 Tax=Candida oxycetoniae TaxID=497107 RepID=A0AAI9SXL4_9ASCO|nr:uncharacterized protein KGF56_002608 [Candida oxycetoniae]KAI3404613.1 hypothetical protein KGF56_002608 [Candida oxycetoniae]
MSLLLRRFNSSTAQEAKRAQAAQLAIQSLKDVGSLLSPSSGSDDPATQPIDTKPIFQDPTLFPHLSLLHQGQVVAELQEKYDKKWTKLSKQDKLLGYFISFGNWGVREKFSDWRSNSSPPLDLPFQVPSNARVGKPGDIVKKLEPVNLSETEVRKDQFNTKKMDPMSKVLIFAILMITMIAVYRDKKIGERGKPKELLIVDKYQVEREKRKKEEEEREAKEKLEQEEEERKRNRRKWYYLYLR